MITKITMDQAASYKGSTSLETDKKVNLIYGLNGTGKTLVSNLLYERSNPFFSKCSVEGITDEELLVYNQRFVYENFYESENVKGIFTLSKENREAQENVTKAEHEIDLLESEKKKYADAIIAHTSDLVQRKLNAENKTWEIKTNFAGGDRVLEYCLTGLMAKKESLFNYLSSVNKPGEQPNITTEELKKDVEAVKGSTAQKHDPLPVLEFSGTEVESNAIFLKPIIGNENSTVADLIKKLGNSDWVKGGLRYIPNKISDDGEYCPFCQEKTITNALISDIQSYFGEAYSNEIERMKELLSFYETAINSLPNSVVYESNPFLNERRAEYENLSRTVMAALTDNESNIRQKLNAPSQVVSLVDSGGPIKSFNNLIEDINEIITDHNKKIDHKEASLAEIKKRFWRIMRWNYDQTISAYQTDKTTIDKKIRELQDKVRDINHKIDQQKAIVVEQQKRTLNIDEAIDRINGGLTELGINSFRIEKESDVLYKIVRDESSGHAFQTLSEGEKTMITFLYFIELCKGKQGTADTTRKKIVIIDDPVSSLSHIYVFNVAELIKSNFTNPQSAYEQIFILTHSLYFFYELTFRHEEDRKKWQNLIRIVRNQDGSEFLPMKYNEVQNDYQSYWQVIRDERQEPALIANCMRNIIEYFFGFVERTEFNNVFQKEIFKTGKYQAFYRYMNRESHSVGQNIFDIKEFDYNDFKNAFRLVFEESGYAAHYEKMTT